MKAFQEVTEWSWPNHIYILNDSKDKAYGYVKRGTKKLETFSKPIRFDAGRRKFKEIPNTYKIKVEEEPVETTGKTYRVAGSKNNIYTVTDDHGSWSCTCPASKWQKGECKHITALKNS